jgi:hypothetical protein
MVKIEAKVTFIFIETTTFQKKKLKKNHFYFLLNKSVTLP